MFPLTSQFAQFLDLHQGPLYAFSQSAAVALLTSLWQGIFVAAGMSLCLRLAPRTSAAHRFLLWSAAFAALVALPLFSLLLQFPAAANVEFSSAFSAKPLLLLDIRWSIALTALWLAASCYRAIDLVLHSLRLRSLWKSASPSDAGANLLAAFRMPGREQIQICTTRDLEKPGVIGFFSPRILIPEWLMSRLTPAELEQIVLHETEHLRRGDDWTNLLQKLALILFPLNPALLWIERRLCLEREMACDEGVVRITHSPRDYAACLASIAERRLGYQAESAALSLGLWHRRPELARRVQSLLLNRPSLPPLGARSLLALLSCGLVFGSFELSRCPQLVAFVSTGPQSVASAADQASVLNATYTPALQAVTQTSPSAQFVRLKAVMPAPAAFRPQPRAASPKTRTSTRRALTANPIPTAAFDMAASETPSSSEQPESFLVLTTWEKVSPATSPSSDAVQDSVQTADAASQPEPAPGQAQVTVTRLIFRVLPSGAKNPSPLPAPVWSIRGAWFVLQL